MIKAERAYAMSLAELQMRYEQEVTDTKEWLDSEISDRIKSQSIRGIRCTRIVFEQGFNISYGIKYLKSNGYNITPFPDNKSFLIEWQSNPRLTLTPQK